MREVVHGRPDVAGAREEIFTLIRKNPTDNLVIYVDGWSGFWAAAVLRSVAQVVPCMKDPPPELCFGTTIYIDCSRWTSMRAMQKKVAQELGLGRETLAMFEEQDEEDDFNGVDLGSRDVIRSAAAVIDRTMRKSRFMMIFINGSHDEIVLGRLGIPENSDCIILWTFSTTTGLSRGQRVAEKLRSTDVLLLFGGDASYLESPQFIALLREEAASIVARHPACMSATDLTAVEDCFLYELLLHHSFGRSTTGFVWPAHAPNFWVCDGTIIQGDRAREVSNALHPEISLECDAHVLDGVLRRLKEYDRNNTAIPLLLVEDDDYYFFGERPCHRWISAKLSYIYEEVSEKLQTAFAKASTIFLSFETEHGTCKLANGLFKQCSNLGVLILSRCAFSFVSPPFRHCHTLRFLGLDHCTDDKKNNNADELEAEGCAAMWAFLKSLWVIDLYYTDWVEILSEDKIEVMASLMELNIEGVRWPQWTSHHLQKMLRNLQRLRVIRPKYEEAAVTTSSDICDSFLVDNTSLEILDLSGSNKFMGRISISEAGHLQVLKLDGCTGLEDVVVSNNSLLRSFSFDGYGPASSSHRTSTVELPPMMSRPEKPPTDADKKNGVVRTSMAVSLAGCTQLDKLFLRGLPNLVELDLSGCAIKVLDFEAMVVDVPNIRRLFLRGCEHLRAIKWGSNDEQRPKQLELICIDTRPAGSERAALGCARCNKMGAQQKSFQQQVHAIIPDARFARSLWAPVDRVHATTLGSHLRHFNIRITSSDASSTGPDVQPAATARGMLLYGDVFTKVGDGPAPMQAFPQAPTGQSNHHVEIGDGSRNVQSETEDTNNNLARLMEEYTESVHVHDVSTCSSTMPHLWFKLRWCRVERCPKLHAVFPPDSVDCWGKLETIWASDLLMARCVWSKGIALAPAPLAPGSHPRHLTGLQRLHLRRCPSLRFALAMGGEPSFISLETLHIIHCGDLRHIFVPWNEENQHTSVEFPELTTIHLHDLPALERVCEAAEMVAPKLETIVIRGCWSLRRLPALKGREPGMRKPAVEVEKDVWDALEWDGVGAGHHPSLYAAPVHSRYYKRRFIRRTVLR